VQTWLISVRYSPEGAAGLAKTGFCSRRNVMRELTQAQGGRLLHFWATGDNDWDVAFIVETPISSSRLWANGILTRSSGTLEALHAQELFTCEEMDRHLEAGIAGWRAAGQ
jgi:hypothetical protein